MTKLRIIFSGAEKQRFPFAIHCNGSSFFSFTGAYHAKTNLEGQVLSDHMLFGSVVATTLVIVVTAQVIRDTP